MKVTTCTDEMLTEWSEVHNILRELCLKARIQVPTLEFINEMDPDDAAASLVRWPDGSLVPEIHLGRNGPNNPYIRATLAHELGHIAQFYEMRHPSLTWLQTRFWNQKSEYRADAFAVKLVGVEAVVAMLEDFYSYDSIDEKFGLWAAGLAKHTPGSWFYLHFIAPFSTHPLTYRRIEAVQALDAEN